MESCHGNYPKEAKVEYFIVNVFGVNSVLLVIHCYMTNYLNI